MWGLVRAYLRSNEGLRADQVVFAARSELEFGTISQKIAHLLARKKKQDKKRVVTVQPRS